MPPYVPHNHPKAAPSRLLQSQMERPLQQAQGVQSQLALVWLAPSSLYSSRAASTACIWSCPAELGLPQYPSLQVTPKLYLLGVEYPFHKHGICCLAHLQPSEGHLEKCLGVTFPLGIVLSPRSYQEDRDKKGGTIGLLSEDSSWCSPRPFSVLET